MLKNHNLYKELAGIIGGVGPEATNYFTSLLVKLRLPFAIKDQDHIPFLLFNNPQIPDRSKHILFNGENPVPEIVKTGLLLKNVGATFLVIPCNTAHTFTKEIEKGVGLPVMNMIAITVSHIYKTYGKNVKVGLLATDGTIKSEIYQETFEQVAPNISLLLPHAKTQMDIMKAIYEIKAFSVNKRNANLLYHAAQELKQRGATIIILGCTEIPLALTENICNFDRIDPMEILAKKVIDRTVRNKIDKYNIISNRPMLFRDYISSKS